MKPFSFENFSHNDAWLIFRLDCQVQSKPMDVYMIMELPTGVILSHELVLDDFSDDQAMEFLKKGKTKVGSWPRRFILPKADPAESAIRKAADAFRVAVETEPAGRLETLLARVKESFGKEFFSPSTIGHAW